MQKLWFTAFGILAPLCIGLESLAQTQDTTRQDIALAAGYKAMFTCSAIFNGGKTQDQISGDELSNFYGDYVPAMEITGDIVVDKSDKYVSVIFADDMPPFISAWRKHLGCTALPQGASAEFIKNLPRVKLKAPKYDPADVMWPMEDKLPNEPLPENINQEALTETVEKAFAGEFKGATTAVLISQNGRIISERYPKILIKITHSAHGLLRNLLLPLLSVRRSKKA